MWLALLPLPPIVFTFVWLMICVALCAHFLEVFALRRRLIFGVYLHRESFLQRYANLTKFQFVRAGLYGLALGTVTIVALFSYTWWKLAIALFGALIGAVTAAVLSSKWLPQAREEFRPYLEHAWLHRGALIGAMILASLCEFMSSRGDYSNWDATKTADTVIQKVKHPIKVVRHIARTTEYVEYTTLRMRDSMGGFGKIAHFLFILPSLIPIAGVIGTFSGSLTISSRDLKR